MLYCKAACVGPRQLLDCTAQAIDKTLKALSKPRKIKKDMPGPDKATDKVKQNLSGERFPEVGCPSGKHSFFHYCLLHFSKWKHLEEDL